MFQSEKIYAKCSMKKLHFAIYYINMTHEDINAYNMMITANAVLDIKKVTQF